MLTAIDFQPYFRKSHLEIREITGDILEFPHAHEQRSENTLKGLLQKFQLRNIVLNLNMNQLNVFLYMTLSLVCRVYMQGNLS
jgi:hypothetical protein